MNDAWYIGCPHCNLEDQYPEQHEMFDGERRVMQCCCGKWFVAVCRINARYVTSPIKSKHVTRIQNRVSRQNDQRRGKRPPRIIVHRERKVTDFPGEALKFDRIDGDQRRRAEGFRALANRMCEERDDALLELERVRAAAEQRIAAILDMLLHQTVPPAPASWAGFYREVYERAWRLAKPDA